MDLVAMAIGLTFCLFLGMVVFSELGRRIGIRQLARQEGLAQGTAAAESAVFALLGLLIAFSFSGAASRFQDRRHLVTEEANAIGTAYLRVDLLPGDMRAEVRDLFRRYVDTRLETYRAAGDPAAVEAGLARGEDLQQKIWARSVEGIQRPDSPPPTTILLMPALNDMIDITTTRLMATRDHPPVVLFALLGVLSLIGALLVGYATSPNKDRSWLHTLVFAAVLSATVYVIVDLEFPRLGLIRVDGSDQVLVDLRESMG